MFDYESGLLISFLCQSYSLINSIILKHSLMEKNLNKIGYRLSWLTLSPKPMDSSEVIRPFYLKAMIFLVLLTFGLLAVLISWIGVAWFVGSLIYAKFKDSGVPNSVREYRWKLRNIDMNFDQIISEIVKVNGESNSASFDELKADYLRGMEDRGLSSQP